MGDTGTLVSSQPSSEASFATPRAQAHSARPALGKGTRAATHRHVDRHSPLTTPFRILVPGRPRPRAQPSALSSEPSPGSGLGERIQRPHSPSHLLPVYPVGKLG